MSPRPVNDKQRKVLDWLAAGGSQDPPEPEMKLSAAALKTRGLVKVRRSGGKWTAELTEAGRYYVEHGGYPPKPGPAPRAKPARAPKAEREPVRRQSVTELIPPAAPEPEATAPEDVPDDVPLRQVIRRPHPAIKEIRDRPGRLPKFARRRCLLIAHSLVTEALARGWKVTPVIGQPHKDYWGTRSVRYDMKSLLLIDAGHAPVGLIFDEVTKRQPHEDTKEEAAKRAKGQYVYTPTYDYIGIGRLRLHLTQRDSKAGNYTDGARTTVEDKLSDVLEAIEAASKQVLHWEEVRRQRAAEEEARRKETERIAKLRHEYETWEAALTDGAKAWRQHVQLREYLAAIEELAPEGSSTFIEWARGHLDATDPHLRLPEGGVPEWPHEDRARTGRYTKPQYGW